MSKKASSFNPAASSRITRSTSIAHSGQIPKDCFAAKVQSIAAKVPAPTTSGKK